MEIRQCTAGDLKTVRDLLEQLRDVAGGAGSLSLPAIEQFHAYMEKYPEVYLNLVAETHGTVVGFESVVFYRTLFHRGGTALINELVVDRNCRGAGIGRALVERARQEAVSRGLDELEVGTERENVAAQRFYRTCGFTEEYVLLGMEFEDAD